MTFRILFVVMVYSLFGNISAEELPVLLAFIEGNVSIDGKAGKDGSLLKAGSLLESAGKSSCSLLVGRSTVIRIGENTKMRITEKMVSSEKGKEEAVVDLKQGIFRALVGKEAGLKKSLKIKTRSSVMGVRGTDVFISAPENLSEPVTFATLEGSAEISLTADSQPSLVLKENQSISRESIPDGGPASESATAESGVEPISSDIIETISEELSGPGPDSESVEDFQETISECKEEFEAQTESSTEEVAGQDERDAPVDLNIRINFN